MYVSWNGLDPVAPTNLVPKTTEGDCTTGGGTGQYTNCPGGRFSTSVSCIFRSNIFDIGTLSSSVAALTSFKYTINFDGVTPVGATWNIDYELWNANDPNPANHFKVGNLNEANSITGDGSVLCNQWVYRDNPNDIGYGNLTGNHYIRIVFTTTNTNNLAGRCVKVDDIFFYYGILSSVDSGSGLTKPTFSTSIGTTENSTSNTLVADVSFNKSAQSSTSCSGGSGTGNDPLCEKTSVKGIYQIYKIDKSTEEGSLHYIENFSIPYQTSAWSWTKTNALHEDESYYYVHMFSYEDWKSDNINLQWKAIQTTFPTWPTYKYVTATQYLDCQQNSATDAFILKSYHGLTGYVDFGDGYKYLVGTNTSGDTFDHLVEEHTSDSTCS